MKLNRKDWVRLLQNPVWQFVGVVVALCAIAVSSFVAYDTLYKGALRQGLSATVYGKFSFTQWPGDFTRDIQVYYRGNEVTDITFFFFQLRNSGDTAIRPEDYITPPRFSIESPGLIADARVAWTDPDIADMTVTKVFSNALELSGSLLNPGDSAMIQVVLIDDTDPSAKPELHFDGRIAGIRDLEIAPYEDRYPSSFLGGRFSIPFPDLVVSAVVTVSLFSATLFAFSRRVSGFWTSRFVGAEIVLIAFMTAGTVFWSYYMYYGFRVQMSPDWWRVWRLPVVGGGSLIILYVGYLWVRLRPARLPRSQ